MNPEVINGTIRRTMLGFEDHGLLSCFVMVEGESWSQGFGGYRLDAPDDTRKDITSIGTAWGMEFIKRVIETVGVETWEELAGKNVRIEKDGLGGRILGIGHITKNKWFRPQPDLDFLRPVSGTNRK